MSVINLNRFRKRKQREEAKKKADANAVRHGRTTPEKQREKAEDGLRQRLLDDAKLDRSTDNDD